MKHFPKFERLVLKDTKQLTENIKKHSLITMTSHGVKVAAFNLAEMKSKEADRRAAVAKEAVMEADCAAGRALLHADLVREASDAASAEALQLAIKMVRAEEYLDESRRLSEEELDEHLTSPDVDNTKFARDWGPTLLSEIETILKEYFPRAIYMHIKQHDTTNGKWLCVFKEDKTKGFVIEQHSKGSAEVGLLTSGGDRKHLRKEWFNGSAMRWDDPFKKENGDQRMKFDLRGKNKEELRGLLRKVME